MDSITYKTNMSEVSIITTQRENTEKIESQPVLDFSRKGSSSVIAKHSEMSMKFDPKGSD